MELYDLGAVPVEVSGMFGELDGTCPFDTNLNTLSGGIEGFFSSSIEGADHMDLISNNSASFVESLIAQLAEFPSQITAEGICPEAPPEPETCLDSTAT